MTLGENIVRLRTQKNWSQATDKFKNNPYVKDYYTKALQNQAIMNGTATPDDPAPAPYNVPTPNDLAQPAGAMTDSLR